MVLCRICIEQVNNPVSLPCGHVFCTNCIVQAIRAVEYFTNFHPCPVCRSVYNIAPVNLKMVPPNLRVFVTPNIRRLYIDSQSPHEEGKNDTTTAATPSEVSRLQAENHALRNHCVMWRRHAEMANLNLIKLAHTTRDEASHTARERDELERRCSYLKRRLDDNESGTRDNATSFASPSYECSVNIEEPPPPPISSYSMSPISLLPASHSPSQPLVDGTLSPRKRLRIDSSRMHAIQHGCEQKAVSDTMPSR